MRDGGEERGGSSGWEISTTRILNLKFTFNLNFKFKCKYKKKNLNHTKESQSTDVFWLKRVH